ncbi:hypothetical protein [Streptacidiphilus sp. PAMC 29251]
MAVQRPSRGVQPDAAREPLETRPWATDKVSKVANLHVFLALVKHLSPAA